LIIISLIEKKYIYKRRRNKMGKIEFSWLYVFIVIGVLGYALMKKLNDKRNKK